MSTLIKHVEAAIFTSPNPATVQEITVALQESLNQSIQEEEIIEAIERLTERYKEEIFAIELVSSSGGYQFLTKEECRDSAGALLKNRSKRKLSRSALETLSIIAYKQPISKGEIEQIRGVGSDYAVRKLLEKGLIVMKGKAQTIGRPTLYGTSDEFLEYFGINHISELPSPKEFTEDDLNEIGTTQEMEQNVVEQVEKV